MRTQMLKRMVRRIEGRARSGACPLCTGRPPVSLREGAPAPPCCRLCGRPASVVLLVRDRDFFHNQHRLLELQRHADGDP